LDTNVPPEPGCEVEALELAREGSLLSNGLNIDANARGAMAGGLVEADTLSVLR
jgi:hypothetical protein